MRNFSLSSLFFGVAVAAIPCALSYYEIQRWQNESLIMTQLTRENVETHSLGLWFSKEMHITVRNPDCDFEKLGNDLRYLSKRHKIYLRFELKRAIIRPETVTTLRESCPDCVVTR
jgi:hypothetical protein